MHVRLTQRPNASTFLAVLFLISALIATIIERSTWGASSTYTQIPYSLKRKASVVNAGPVDHAGELMLQSTKTAVASPVDRSTGVLPSSIDTYITYMQRKITWKQEASALIMKSFDTLPQRNNNNETLMNFMMKCDCLDQPHGTGETFMRHLQVCHDIAYFHYPFESPRVLLMHSFYGFGGVNYFPMPSYTLDSVLPSLLTPREYLHVQAFPSLQRMLDPLLTELSAHLSSLHEVMSITFSRLPDNKKLAMTVEDLWTALNYQLIHLIDFFPVQCWAIANTLESEDYFVTTFSRLHGLLNSTGQLRARIGLSRSLNANASCPSAPAALREGRDLFLLQFQKPLAEVSAAIGHDAGFRLLFKKNRGQIN